MRLQIRRASAADLPRVLEELAGAGLPTDDLVPGGSLAPLGHLTRTVGLAPPRDRTPPRGLAPPRDLTPRAMNSAEVAFWVAEVEHNFAGCIGLQTAGTWGLLRSLVVAGEFRSMGVGGRLVDVVLAEAARKRLDTIVLLTATAETYFSSRGFEPVSRDEVPEEMRMTREFLALCPETAACLRKKIG